MGYDTSPPEQMQWDLRLFYVSWISKHMMDFYKSRESEDYGMMLKEIREWHGAVWGRSIRGKEFNPENYKDKTFEDILDKIIKKALKHKQTWLKFERNPNAIAEIDEMLLMAEVYIIFLMKKNKMFGTDSINRSLT